MGMLDGSMVSIALPTITTHFNVNLAQSQWAITGYMLAMTGLFIFFGKIADFTGKTRLFLTGWALFTVSSLACGLSTNLEQLVLFRIFQGIGGSMVTAVAGALIFEIFPQEERGKAMGFFGIVFGAGTMIGPGLGGFIVDHFGWEYIFIINVPLGIVLLALAAIYLKVPEKKSGRFEIDWIGAASLCIAVVTLMLACTEIATDLKVTAELAIYAAACLASTTVFLARESRIAKPLLDLSIFRNRKFTLPLLSTMFMFIPISVVSTLSPFYFQGVMGYTPSQVGLIFMVIPLFMMFAAPASGALYDKRHWRFQAAAGMLVSAASFALLAYAFLIGNIWLVLAAFVIRGVGGGFFMSPNSVETMSSVPREKTAIASSASSTITYLAVMLGVALSTVFLTAYLNMAGYAGPTFLAGAALLSDAMAAITLVAGAFCILSAATAALRNI